MSKFKTKELAYQFIEDTGVLKNKSYPFKNEKIFEYEEKIDKSFFDMNEEDFINFFFDYVGISTVATLDVYRGLYLKFYQWCIRNHYTDGDNIFEGNVQLDPDTLAAYMSQRCKLFYYDDLYLEKICSHIKKDKIYTEILIRLFYEGISSYDEIMYLQKEQIDFNESILYIDDRRIAISNRLNELLWLLMNGYVEEKDNDSERKLAYTRFQPKDVFVFRSQKDTPFNRRQYMSRRINDVKSDLKLEDLSIKKLYQSGLLQTIYKACDCDTNKLIHILYEDKNKQTNFVLDDILKKHGYKITSYRVRSLFKPYMMQLAAAL